MRGDPGFRAFAGFVGWVKSSRPTGPASDGRGCGRRWLAAKRRGVRSSLLLALLLLLPAPARASEPGPPPRPALDALDDFINRAMPEFRVPGLAIAIVKDDKVVKLQGYGVREMGKDAPVNEDTLFAAASTTKAFTAATLAMLVGDGKVRWDDRVTKHIPGFELFDPYATREVTVRDLLTHRAGLPAYGGDLLFYAYRYDRDELVRRARFVKPARGFRDRFAYQNLMFTTAGQVAARASGTTWDAFLRKRVFAPLGMKATNTSVSALEGNPNVVTPHGVIDGKLVKFPWRNIDGAGGAGVINSSVRDMAQWVRLQLGEGTLDGRKFWSKEAHREMQMPQTVMRLEGPITRRVPGAHFLSYGMGWMLWDYRGRKVVEHGGNLDGLSAMVALLPEEKLGVVVFANQNLSFLPRAIALRVFDTYLGGEAGDHGRAMLDLETEVKLKHDKTERETLAKRKTSVKPTLELPGYAGKYRSELYGDAGVFEEKGKLTLKVGTESVGALEPFRGDTFLVTWKNPADGQWLVTFELNSLGELTGLRLAELATPDEGDMHFARQKGKK